MVRQPVALIFYNRGWIGESSSLYWSTVSAAKREVARVGNWRGSLGDKEEDRRRGPFLTRESLRLLYESPWFRDARSRSGNDDDESKRSIFEIKRILGRDHLRGRER
jgi:hypothetical protein